MTKKRRRIKHIATFEERLAQEATKLKEAAEKRAAFGRCEVR